MERSSQLMALAMCLYALSLVEYTAFVPMQVGTHTGATGSLRGSVGYQATPNTSSMASGLRTAAALVAVSAAAMSVRGSRAQAGSRIQMYFTRSPEKVYATALKEGAKAKEEVVGVAQDMIRLKGLFNDFGWRRAQEPWRNDPELIMDKNGYSKAMLEATGPYESETAKQFVMFLGKKNRLSHLWPIAEQYVKSLYTLQGIKPVRVTTAEPLTPEQKQAVIDKMKKKTGAMDIKLQCVVDDSVLGGMKIEWNFIDPDTWKCPTDELDGTFRTHVEQRALESGVVL